MKNFVCLMICVVAIILVSPVDTSAADGYDVAAYYWPGMHYDGRWAPYFEDGSKGEWYIVR